MGKSQEFKNSRWVAAKLGSHFGAQDLGNKTNPFNELVFIILSAKTAPDNYARVYRNLRGRFPRADDLSTARKTEIEQAIKGCGFEHKRAEQIFLISRKLKKDFGRVTLRPLSAMTDKEAEAYLTSLPGVGIKSARCVLMYSLNRDVFPVDSHCFRIMSRLGWIRGNKKWSVRTADFLQNGVPEKLRRQLHVGFILLGRTYCMESNPACSECPIIDVCPTGRAYN